MTDRTEPPRAIGYAEAGRLVRKRRYALGTVYSCPLCPAHEVVMHGRRDGRGHGLREGGGAFSRMASHIFRTHHNTQERSHDGE